MVFSVVLTKARISEMRSFPMDFSPPEGATGNRSQMAPQHGFAPPFTAAKSHSSGVRGYNSMTMPCKRKLLLTERYAEAAHQFSGAVQRLLERVQDKSVFDPISQAAPRAREKCNLACLALDKHRGQHGC